MQRSIQSNSFRDAQIRRRKTGFAGGPSSSPATDSASIAWRYTPHASSKASDLVELRLLVRPRRIEQPLEEHAARDHFLHDERAVRVVRLARGHRGSRARKGNRSRRARDALRDRGWSIAACSRVLSAAAAPPVVGDHVVPLEFLDRLEHRRETRRLRAVRRRNQEKLLVAFAADAAELHDLGLAR